MPRSAPLLAALLLAPALAGCLGAEDAGDDPAPSRDPDPGSGPLPLPPREPGSLGRRWHFHNYWGTSDNLTLHDGPVVIGADPALGADRAARVGAGTFAPADGRIVPPETGRISVEVSWNGSLAPRPLTLLYRAANESQFRAAGAAWPGPANVTVAEAMADAPHTGASGWAFRLEAAPDERGLAFANGTVHVRAVAWLGRPIIIDPPHRDAWDGTDVLPLVAGAFEGRAWRTPQGVVVQNGTRAETAQSLLALVPPNGSVVPEGAGSILVRLAWSSAVSAVPAPASFVVRWSEGNTLGSGLAEREGGGADWATYRILVDAKSVDSPYSARSSWRLDVDLDEKAPAFEGTVRAQAWVMKSADGAAPG